MPCGSREAGVSIGIVDLGSPVEKVVRRYDSIATSPDGINYSEANVAHTTDSRPTCFDGEMGKRSGLKPHRS